MFSFLDFDKLNRGKVRWQGDDGPLEKQVRPAPQLRGELDHSVRQPESQEF